MSTAVRGRGQNKVVHMMAPELLGGRYEVRGVLGRGGMAEVREAIDTRTGYSVAIKLLYAGYDTNPEYLHRFWLEAQAASALHHPNIVNVYDSGQHRGAPYLVMERLPGRSLAEVIAIGPVPPPSSTTSPSPGGNAAAIARARWALLGVTEATRSGAFSHLEKNTNSAFCGIALYSILV